MCSVKDTAKRMKKKRYKLEEKNINHISERRLVSKIYKEISKFNGEKKNVQLENEKKV